MDPARRSRKSEIRNPKSKTNSNQWKWPEWKNGKKVISSQAATKVGYCSAKGSSHQGRTGVSPVSITARRGQAKCVTCGSETASQLAPNFGYGSAGNPVGAATLHHEREPTRQGKNIKPQDILRRQLDGRRQAGRVVRAVER
jgi:hypothetical protein